MLKLGVVVVLLWASVCADCALANVGDRDSAFGDHGVVTLPGLTDTRPSEVALDSSGNALVGQSAQGMIGLHLLDPTGRLVATFGDRGTVLLSDGYLALGSVAFDDAGRIVVGAQYAPQLGGPTQLVVFRLLADGGFDGTFGSGGKVFISGSGLGGLEAAIPDHENRIVFVRDGAMQRLLSDGTPDLSFGTDGQSPVLPDLPEGRRQFSEPVIGENGSISMIANDLRFDLPEVYVQRVTDSGTLDAAFGDNGVVRVPSDGDLPAIDLGVDATGGAFLALRQLWRLTPDGGSDSVFNAAARDVDLQRPGPLVVNDEGQPVVSFSGQPGHGFNLTTGLVRLSAEGQLDHSFGVDGYSYPYQGVSGIARSDLALGADGSMVLSGSAIVRFQGESPPTEDADADSIDDGEDRCIWLAGRRSKNGCPTTTTSVNIAAATKRFVRGTLASPMPACVTGAKILLLAKHKGQDRQVGRVNVRRGRWRFNHGVSAERLYVRARPRDRGSRGFCRGARAATD